MDRFVRFPVTGMLAAIRGVPILRAFESLVRLPITGPLTPCPATAHARRVRPVLLALALLISASLGGGAAEAARVEAEAVAGRPFGVAKVTVPLGPDATDDTMQFSVTEENGRVLYPTFSTTGPARRILGQLLRGGEIFVPRSVTATFLFTGDGPLRVTFHTPRPMTVTVTPQGRVERVQDRLMRQWWREYYAASTGRAAEGDYPPLVETYLVSMLSQRLGLDAPLLRRGDERNRDADSHEGWKTLELLAGAESLHLATLRETVRGRGDLGRVADQPLPEDVLWQAEPAIEVADDVPIEPMALRVPPEFFYVRFGNFPNYLWLNRLMQDYGGDLANMVTGRGIEMPMSRKIERQLAVRYTEMSELLGGEVVADMAMIGRDTFMREGGAFGLLFQAKNPFLLDASLNQERLAVLARERENGATTETVEIAGRRVSLLSTPDNRVRSFFANHENYRLITSSRTMVERFYAVVEGETSLGQTAEFRYARTLLPLERDDTIFIHLSSGFFRGLVSPQYQIELERRLKAVTDIDLLRMARLAARAENRPADSIEDLVAGGFLPRDFGRRPDGSGPVEVGETIVDSLRGARGSFLPIADVPLTSVTRREAAAYLDRAAFYRHNWQQMDPLMIAIRRYALDVPDQPGLERLVIDANVAPFGEEKYGRVASLLGPPIQERIATAPGDIITVQASVRGGLLSPSVPPHHLFLGIQDVEPVTDMRFGGLLKTLRVLQTTPGYVGAWPKPGFLDWLPLGLAGQPDVAGYSSLPLGLWRRQFEDFSVLSFDRPVLAHVTQYLDPVETENPAQVRVHVGDLAHSQLSGWVNGMLYERAYNVSRGNAQLMHTLTEQLRVPGPDALATAERLVDARLVCPLGGTYEPVTHEGGATVWRSTAWQNGPAGQRVPEDYRATLLDWFRGVDAELTKDEGRLMVHAELDMQRKATAARPALPFFNFFGGGAKSESAPAKEKEQEQREPEALPPPSASPSNGPREF